MKPVTPGTVRLYEAVGSVEGSLPSEITDIEAEAQGLLDELQRAIEAGQYQPVCEITLERVEVINGNKSI